MNQYLTLGLFSGSASLAILSIDGLTKDQVLNKTKLYSDLLMAQLNISIWVVFISLLLIFYPAKLDDGTQSTPSVNNNVTNSNYSNVPSTPKSLLHSPTIDNNNRKSMMSMRNNNDYHHTIKITDDNTNKN